MSEDQENKQPVTQPPVSDNLLLRGLAKKRGQAAAEAETTEPPINDDPKESPAPVNAEKVCKNHPKKPEHAYGLCSACIQKLSPIDRRRLYLEARINGANAHNYPGPALKAWREELVLIQAGLWKAPMKMRTKNKLAGEILG